MKQSDKTTIFLIICILTTFLVGENAIAQGNLKVGASKVNISPAPEMLKSMTNYGGLQDATATQIEFKIANKTNR